MTETPEKPTPNPLPPNFRFDDSTVRKGVPEHPLTDLYYEIQRGSWPRLLVLYVGGFLVANLFFAALYMLGGDCIIGAEPGSFRDMFFFSVQTLATIGYGALAPKTTYAHVIVMIEAMVGLLGVALGTGLAFAKFARPSAKMLFSRNILLAPYDGRQSLYFRVANVRGNDVVEATVRVVALRSHVLAEGHSIRRLEDLALVRSSSPLFRLSWLVVHVIDERSPLWGLDVQAMIDDRVLLIVSLTGLDGTFAQSVHARHVYAPSDVLTGHRFGDIMRDLPDGRIEFDYAKFHDVVPLPPIAAIVGERSELLERDAEAIDAEVRDAVVEQAEDEPAVSGS
ncbi:ion channel [Nannocystaceae bacterium ST9]